MEVEMAVSGECGGGGRGGGSAGDVFQHLLSKGLVVGEGESVGKGGRGLEGGAGK